MNNFAYSSVTFLSHLTHFTREYSINTHVKSTRNLWVRQNRPTENFHSRVLYCSSKWPKLAKTTTFIILLCLTPDKFNDHGKASGRQRVKKCFPQNVVYNQFWKICMIRLTRGTESLQKLIILQIEKCAYTLSSFVCSCEGNKIGELLQFLSI